MWFSGGRSPLGSRRPHAAGDDECRARGSRARRGQLLPLWPRRTCYVLLDPPRNIMEQRPDLRFCCMCLWLVSTTVVAVQLVSLMMICVLFSSKKKERPGTTQLAVQRLPRVPDRKVAASSEAAASRLAAPGRLFFFSERGGKGQFCTFVLVGWFASESRDFWVFAARVSLQN